MIQISFYLNGFWFHVKLNKKYNVGYDQHQNLWCFRNGRIVHADNPAMSTNKFYSEPLKEVA